MKQPARRSVAPALTLVIAVMVFVVALFATAAQGAVTYPSDSNKPNLVNLLTGMNSLWTSSGSSDLHGTVVNGEVLAHNDELAVWINNHATGGQQFKALQDANYTAYQLVQDGLGSELGPLYLQGLKSGALPLTNALLGNVTGYVGTEEAKTHYSYPRPYLPSDTSTSDTACNLAQTNASSLRANREGKADAGATGNLNINRLANQTDNTGTYVGTGTSIGAGYSGFCNSGSFPSGHTTAAYLGGLTLATLLPELAPAILARASEQANDRIVLGVHYPLDIIGGRIAGEAGVAARWSDAQYRKEVLLPARAELVSYLEAKCGEALADCIAHQTPYTDDPYGGAAIPGGGAQTVTDEASAVSVYTERLTYGFTKPGTTGLAASVPASAANLLLTTFPTLSTAQRTSVLAQTEIESGYPLDQSGSGEAWQRLNLAAAMSAKVELAADGSVHVASTGGAAEVVAASAAPTLTAPNGTTVTAGTVVPLSAAGLQPGEEYEAVWAADHSIVLGSFVAAGDGSGLTNATIPVAAAAGAHTVELLDSSGTDVLAAPLTLTVTTTTYPEAVTTTSPDGKTIATVFVNQAGELGYTVAQNGETVVQPSRLGLTIAGSNWGTGVTLGQGILTNEFEIADEADLALIREHPGGTFDLTADITMTHPWAPIGAFTGTLNGNGHTITDLEVEGSASKAFFQENKGTIRQLGFIDGKSIIPGAYVEANRAAVVTVINKGTIEQVWTEGADVEGGWRGAPIAAMNEATITNSYTVDSKVVANWESGGIVGWNSATGQISNSYVAGANITAVVSSGGIFAGYGYTGTKLSNDVVYSGTLSDPNTTNRGRILARENGTPTYSNNLALNTATINGATVSGGTATNKNGKDTTEAELQQEATYTAIGWNFSTVWKWDATLNRPVLRNESTVGAPSGDEVEAREFSEDSTYPLIGTHSTAVDHFEGKVIPVEKGGEKKLGIEMRVYDTGVAFRYDLADSLAGKTVSAEGTTFAFDPSSEMTYQASTSSTIDDLQGDTTQGVLSTIGTKEILMLPTIESPDGREYANVTEANVRDWPASALKTTAGSGSISTYYWATDNGAGTFNVSANTLHSPFRVLTVAPNLTELTNSDIITDVNPSIDTSVFPGGDDSWVDPNVASWASLNAAVGQNQSVSIISKLIENSSKAHIPTVLVEGKMADASWGSNTAEKFAHLKALVEQGEDEENPVKIWLWTDYDSGSGADSTFTSTITYGSSPYSQTSLQNPYFREAYFDLVKSTGVIGVKVDHIGNETETKVNVYADIDKAAAERELMIEFHNPLEPTGLNRTYPNEVGREAIRGAEINYAADQDTELPYTRYVDGTADYTPLIFSNASKQNNATWAHEVASTVAYTNPYLQISEDPANLAPGGVYHALLGSLVENLPTVWKRSWVLPQSSLGGRLAGVVRETADGEYWLAVMATPGRPVQMSIPLDFLPAGTTYNADEYADKQSASSMKRTTTSVDSGTTLTPTLQSGGGYLVRITTEEIENPGSGDGEGTQYEIATEGDLAKIAEHPGATFNLTADITMQHPWTPVPMFTGTINGNGHTITDLEVEGGESKAFILDNQGTIQQLGFAQPKSVVAVSDPTVTGSYTQTTRVAVVAVTNDGTIDQVYTKQADVEGGWRSAPIAAENNGLVTNSYTVDSKVVANWEAGATVAWNSASGLIEDSYVAGANVTCVVSNGGIFTGYGYAGTQIDGDVVYSGKLVVPTSGNQGRILARENGTPTYNNDLALNTATINGATVGGGSATNKNGQDATEAELQQQSTYDNIGWNFDTVWKWDADLKRPVLLTVAEAAPVVEPTEFDLATEADLAKIRQHPEATFHLTADIAMTQPWAPVPVFSGTLEGGGHTISGLEVEGNGSKAFISTNQGTIRSLGFVDAKSIITAPYSEANREAIVTVINQGTIERVFTKRTDVEGGWRGAPIAAMNEKLIRDCYTVDSKVVANWESGAMAGWTSAAGTIEHSYVVGADVTAVVSNGAIFAGYGYAGTHLTGDVVVSGSLSDPNATNKGRIMGRENGTPTYADNLSVETATVNGSLVDGGTATNKNGKDVTAAELRQQSTYTGIGWDFGTVWRWDPTVGRPLLQGVGEPMETPVLSVAHTELTYPAGSAPSEAELLADAGASTDVGVLTLDLAGVDFSTPGTYIAAIGADNGGAEATPVPVTVNVTAVVVTTPPPTETTPPPAETKPPVTTPPVTTPPTTKPPATGKSSKDDTKATLTVGHHKAKGKQVVDLTIHVTAPGNSGKVKGSVKVYLDSHLIKTVELEKGVAELSLPGLKHGTHQIKVVFAGSSSLASSSDTAKLRL